MMFKCVILFLYLSQVYCSYFLDIELDNCDEKSLTEYERCYEEGLLASSSSRSSHETCGNNFQLFEGIDDRLATDFCFGDNDFDLFGLTSDTIAADGSNNNNTVALGQDRNIVRDIQKEFDEKFPFPDKFDFHTYDIINWPEKVPKFKRRWTIPEIKLIRSCMQDFRFIKRQKGIQEIPDIVFEHDPSMTGMRTHEFLIKRYREETGLKHAKVINWKRLDRDRLPRKFDSLTINAKTMGLSKLHKNPELVNNIHFSIFEVGEILGKNIQVDISTETAQNLVSDPNARRRVQRKMNRQKWAKLMEEIQRNFEIFFPGNVFDFRNYDIANWPESVKKSMDSFRTLSEIESVEAELPNFVYVKREMRIENEDEAGAKTAKKDFECVLDDTMTLKTTMKLLLERFRTETDWSFAKQILWERVDRSRIPKKYEAVKIDSKSIRLRDFFQNPEIVNNVHFFKYSEEELQLKRANTGILIENQASDLRNSVLDIISNDRSDLVLKRPREDEEDEDGEDNSTNKRR